MSKGTYLDRDLRICYLNTERQVLDAQRIVLEKRLKLLSDSVSMKHINSLDDPSFRPCDALVVAASKIPVDDFSQWLVKFSERIEAQGFIWVPALIISNASFITLKTVFKKAVQMNWYFDIMAEEHIDSLPIRLANLLRINDHLHELGRYEESLDSLGKQLDNVNATLNQLKGG